MGNICVSGGLRSDLENEKYRAFRKKLINDPASVRICSKYPENSFRGDIFIQPKKQ